MILEAGLVAALKADATVAAYVGTRVYHMQMPQEPTYPCITYQRISTTQGQILDGVDTLTEVRIQIDSWGETVTAAMVLGEAVKALLNGYIGAMGSANVQICRMESMYDLGSFDGDDRIRRVTQDYVFTLHE